LPSDDVCSVLIQFKTLSLAGLAGVPNFKQESREI
jgi:hypothetical protein